ncbi:MAG: 4Fe-4S binding protein [Candidatus Eisenbacteria bacterium]
MAKIKTVRRLFQLFFLGGSVALLIRGLMGLTSRTVEYYCPMGGIVSIYGLFRKQQFICALNETNLSIALVLLVGVILIKKSFCGWVCPLGTIFDWFAWLRRKTLGKDFLRIPDLPDAVLSKIKYVVLAIILILTFRASELIFRGYDPFYILFTGGKGHGLIPVVSLVILIGVLVTTFIFEMAWCRYLCPLGAVMSPLSRFGLLKVKRNRAHCSGCGVCDTVCLQRIPVSKLTRVTRTDCTICLDCVARCPEDRALDIGV